MVSRILVSPYKIEFSEFKVHGFYVDVRYENKQYYIDYTPHESLGMTPFHDLNNNDSLLHKTLESYFFENLNLVEILYDESFRIETHLLLAADDYLEATYTHSAYKVKNIKNKNIFTKVLKKAHEREHRLRFDFQESLSRSEFNILLSEVSPVDLNSVEYIEDPYSFHSGDWCEDEKKYELKLARDKSFEPWEGIKIYKPLFKQNKSQDKEFVMSSMMSSYLNDALTAAFLKTRSSTYKVHGVGSSFHIPKYKDFFSQEGELVWNKNIRETYWKSLKKRSWREVYR